MALVSESHLIQVLLILAIGYRKQETVCENVY